MHMLYEWRHWQPKRGHCGLLSQLSTVLYSIIKYFSLRSQTLEETLLLPPSNKNVSPSDDALASSIE